MQALNAQSVFNETFTGSTAAGWVFKSGVGDVKPFLTAATGSNGSGGGTAIDSSGQGWLRLTEDIQNQSTSALLDTQIFSVNAKIEIEMEYAFYSKGASTGADGISFFLVDGSVDSSTFVPGAYGGSMGYAQKTNEAGMAGGYLGFGFDTFGNYTNNDEGRVGGRETGLEPNRVAVRGPASSDWAFIKESADLDTIDFNGSTTAGGTGQFMAVYDSATRPDQSGEFYRQFKITLDANNQLTVDMRFGVGNAYVTVFTADLSGYERPDTFKIGFTGATGDAYGIHEIRQVSVTTTPWSSGSGAYEWDNSIPGTGTTAWGTGGNWDTDSTPTAKSDVLFGNKPTNNGANNSQQVQLSSGVEVRNLTFDTGINYTIGESAAGAGNQTITFGKNSSGVGLPSINVNDYNHAYARHKINANISLAENIAIRNYSYSTLCLNGTFATNGNTITTSGYGATNLNGQITGSGDLIVNGSTMQGTGAGIVTISGPNTTWSGDVTVNGGQLVVLGNNALGSTNSNYNTTVNSGGTLTFRGGVTTGESLVVNGSGTTLGRGELAGAIYNDGGESTISGPVTLAGNTTIRSRDGNLTLSGAIGQSGSNRSLTKTGDGVVTLTNSGNSYSGATVIQGGVLRIENSANALPGGFATANPSGGNLTLNGGVLEIGRNSTTSPTATLGTFTRQVGTSADQVQWTGDGGFSAYGYDATVTLGSTLTWASGSFVQNNKALLLSSDFSNAKVTLTNNIALAGTASTLREVRVANGSAALDATLSGVLSGAAGINKTGAGTLSLTGTNTYTGDTVISGGALRVASTTALGAAITDAAAADKTTNAAASLSTSAITQNPSATTGSGTSTLTLSSVAGLSVGQVITGSGIRTTGAATTITAINGNTITLSRTTNSSVGTGTTLTFTPATGSNTLKFTSTSGLVVGQAITGTNIPAGTTIAAISGNIVTLSQNLTGTVNSNTSLSFSYVSGNTSLTLANTTGLAVGQGVTGTNIPAGTTITAISGNTVTLSNGLTGNLNGNSTLSFGALTHGDNLVLNGGVLELANGYGTFTRSLGDNTSTSAIRWTGDGGFSAFDAGMTVNIGGSGATLTWGDTHFVGANNKLLFGSTSSDNTVTLSNNLNLGASGDRTIKVTAGTNSSVASGAISGVVSGAANLKVTGNGRLDLTAANTYTGSTTIIGSEVRLNGANGSLASTSITVQQGGRLTLDNGSAANANRLADTAAVSLNGGTLSLIGRGATASDITETIGAVTLSGGANTIDLARSNSDSFIRLAAASLTRSSTSAATINFTNTGGTFGGDDNGNNPRVTFSTAPTALIDDGILAFATINGTDFATHGATGIVAATYSDNNLDKGSWSLTTNYTGDSATTVDLSASSNLNSLRLVNGADINLGAHQLTVDSGGILTTGSGGTTISGTGILTTNNSKEFVVHAYNTGGTTISATIGGSGGLVKSGTGTLTLSGSNQNTNSGKTTVNEGTLVLAKSANTTAIAGDLVIGDGRGQDIVRIDANEQIANSATVTLRGGEIGNSANVASLVFADANGSITESFGTLKIEGNTVLDFAGGNPCAPSFLYLDVLDIAGDGLLTIKNWVEFTDFLLIKKVNADPDDLARIVFDGYGGAAAWKSYDSNYYQLVPYAPVPEPGTFGLLSLGGLGSFALLRRRRRA